MLPQEPILDPERPQPVGALWVAGDRACADGDLEALAAHARKLAEDASEPMHCELLALAEACLDPVRATSAWVRLKRITAHGLGP